MGQLEQSSELLETVETWASVSGDPSRQLNNQQRQFAAYFVATANGTQAAELAGYSNPNSQAHRLRCNPRVAALIKRLSLAHLDAAVPLALAELARQVIDPTVSNNDRRKAAESLLDRAGIRRSDAPSVAVQVNVGGDAPASTVIRQVWDAREARMSGIAAPMRDTSEGETIEPGDG